MAGWIFSRYIGTCCQSSDHRNAGLGTGLAVKPELGIFTSWVWLLAKNRALIWVSGPLAYVLTKCISAPMIGLFQDTTPWTFWAGSIVNALPGLVILTVLTLLFVRYEQSHT